MVSKLLKYSILLLLLSAVTFSSGCVYYNTFYNAKKAFNEAEKAREKNKYTSGRGGTAQYKIAIEKSLKIIDNHPNTKYYDDALFVLAVSYFHTNEFNKADRRFRELLANYQESEFVKESELYLAKTKLQLKDQDEAMQLFEKIFVADYEKSFKSEAALELGIYHFDNKDYREAQTYLLAVRDSLGNNAEKRIAQKYIADGYFNIFQFNSALGAYLQMLGMNPDKNEKYYALYQASQAAFSVMKISEGMDYLNTLKNDELYFDSLGSLDLAIAEGYLIEGDIENAEAIYLEKIKDETDRRVAGTAHYQLGLLAQFEYDDLLKAKEYFDAAVKLIRGQDIGKYALEKSSDIGKLETYARTLIIDSTTAQEQIDDAAYTQFQLAQLYWFSLNKPDTAMLEMQYLIDSFPTAYDVPNAMIALSQMYREYKSDTTTSDSLLREVINKHPSSDRIPQVLELLGLKGTPADTGYAELYIRKAEDFLVDSDNIDSAKYYYQYVVDNFPESDYYLHARFAVLWVTEEYQAPGDSSLYFAYDAFVDSFPGTPWAQEATRRVRSLPRQEVAEDQGEDGELAPGDSASVNAGDDEFPGNAGVTKSGLGENDEYMDPELALYVDPDGNRAIDMPLEPERIKDEFEYPVEAYRSGWEGELAFQILLDFSGEVVDYILKIRSPNAEIDKEASLAVSTMVFDMLRIPPDIQESWFVYKFKVRKPDQLR